MGMKRKALEVNDKVKFVSGNFEELTGIILLTDYNSDHPNAMYGYYHVVKLSDGRIGYIEKSEHWRYI